MLFNFQGAAAVTLSGDSFVILPFSIGKVNWFFVFSKGKIEKNAPPGGGA